MARPRTVFLLGCLAAVALLTAAYSNHFDNAFHFDDNHVIVNNLAIRSLHDIPGFFTDPTTFTARPQNAVYRPLLTLSHAIDHAIGGGSPRQFHRTQFGLLLLLGACLVLFYRRLFDAVQAGPWNRWIALAAATLFCIHTANTETVNYISSRSSLVATLGVVGSFVLYLEVPHSRRWHLYLLPMLVGGLAKPLTVMFAPLLLLFVLLFEERENLPGLLLRTVPAFVAGLALFLFLGRMDADTLEYSDIDRWAYAGTQPFVWLHYLRLFLWPVGLTADTDWRAAQSWGDPRVLWGGLFVVALGLAILLLSRTKRLRPVAFGLGWFAVALLPTSSLVPLSEIYNEHRIFFPYVGLAAAAGWSIGLALRRIRAPALRTAAAGVLIVGVLGAHAAGTHVRNRVWQTPETLWGDVTVKSPRNARGQMNYGLTLMGRGEVERALEHFERGEKLAPNYSILQVNLAIAKSTLGDPAAAEVHFRRALQLTPDYAAGHFYYARWLVKHRRAREAVPHLRDALEISPGDSDANHLLLDLYAAQDNRVRLEEHARRVLEIAPGEPAATAYLEGRVPYSVEEESAEGFARAGFTMIQLEDWPAAAVLYREALELDPEASASWNDLGWALGQAGFNEQAAACFERAIELDPDNERPRSNLAWLRGG